MPSVARERVAFGDRAAVRQPTLVRIHDHAFGERRTALLFGRRRLGIRVLPRAGGEADRDSLRLLAAQRARIEREPADTHAAGLASGEGAGAPQARGSLADLAHADEQDSRRADASSG